MLLKLVPIPLPTLVVRKIEVKSMKPPGVKSAPPMRNESGDSLETGSLCCCSAETDAPGPASEVEAEGALKRDVFAAGTGGPVRAWDGTSAGDGPSSALVDCVLDGAISLRSSSISPCWCWIWRCCAAI